MLSLASFLLLLATALLIAHAAIQSKALRALRACRGEAGAATSTVTVIVPARDEARNIGPCLAGILGQSGLGDRLGVVAVDDASTDATPGILRRLAASDPRLTAIAANALPAGWLGKPHACWTGYAAAGRESDWLCFIDADVRIAPRLLRTAIAAAEAEGLHLLSLAPRQVLGSFAERLILPIGFYMLAFRQDLRKMQDPARPAATAAGLFILVRRSTYEAAGGHAAVRAAVCEDVELARRAKACGGRIAMWDGGGFLDTRMYRGFADLWEGVAKNLVDMLGGPVATLATIVVANAVVWGSIGLPVAAGLAIARSPDTGGVAAGVLSGAAFAAILGFHVAGARHFRVPPGYALLYPLAYAVGSLIALDSVRRRMGGKVRWKGRSYRLSGHGK